MSGESRHRVRFAWLPIRQVARTGSGLGEFDFTGAVYWFRCVYAVNNLYHGWIAHMEQQTEENLRRCAHCNGTGKT